MILLEDILQGLDAGVLLIDSEHRTQWMNKKALEWFSASKLGERRMCYRTMGLGNGFCTICPTGRTIDFGTATHYEMNFPVKGVVKNFELIAIPVYDKDNRPSSVLELIMDITERGVIRIKENDLMCQIEKMAAIGQLAAGVAHELNTPLGTISIISEELDGAIQGVIGKDAPKKILLEYLTDMKLEVARCKSIINDLLDFSKRGVSYFTETDINALVTKTAGFINKGGMKRIPAILLSLDPALPVIMTDPDRFRQVLFNIIKNAVEAVEEKEDGTIGISTRVESCFVCVSVKDNGPGIPEADLKRVFDPFFTTKEVGKGTGLGLSVSYGIMRDIKGVIRLDTVIGKGTTVTLQLPVGNCEAGGQMGFNRPESGGEVIL